jgi:hypothetical protein
MSYKIFALDVSPVVFSNAFLRLSIENCWEKPFMHNKQRIGTDHLITGMLVGQDKKSLLFSEF